jgi:hypothetical protein
MRIGLYNLEPKINNTAMMQVSQYYKERGDHVEHYNHINNGYDLAYAFSLFDFTDKSMVADKMICGGTGFDIESKLPKEIEACDLDYSIFPNCKTSYIWFSRGCVRNCPWCVVRRKEGILQPVAPKNLNPKGEYITVMDNNFFANPEWEQSIKWLKDTGQKTEFQGVDARILDYDMAQALNSLKHYKTIKFAWDNPEDDFIPILDKITKWIKPYKLMCYVLIGYNSTPEQDLYRVETLRKFKISPFVMPFNKRDRYQMDFGRWCNRKELFKSCSFKDYIFAKLTSPSKRERYISDSNHGGMPAANEQDGQELFTGN